MENIIYIAAKKIKDGIVKAVTAAQKALKRFFEKAHEFLKRASIKYSQKDGCEYKGQTHCYTKKNGQFVEGTDIINIDTEMGEYYRTTVTKKVSEEEVPPQYREIKDDEIMDNTEELDAVLSF